MSRLLPALALLLSHIAYAGDSLTLQTAQIRTLGIETEVAGKQTPGRGGMLPARVLVPNAQMRLVSAPVGGMVDMLAVAPGNIVRKGQVVARLASPQALELQRDALQSGSQSALLQQNLKRDEQLFAEGLIAESRLQATRAAAAQAGAQANERRQGLALAGIAPGQIGGPLALTAPIDGVVLEQGVQLGQRVESATLIYRIARLSPLWLEVQAPLDLASGLSVGMSLRIPSQNLDARLITIGRAIDPASQTVLLRAEVSKGAERLTPGQAVEVELISDKPNIHLPASAIVRHEGKSIVFVETGRDDKQGHFMPRPIKILTQGGNAATVDGLQAGEKVVVRGTSGLKAMLTGVGRE